jgi:NitT/TauT family transport system ATP-binding protein/nitrate/nitrite transport system substrate-binding protein
MNAASIRIGLVRLTDAAPVIIAAEKGLFADRGLDVRLSVEPSWANIADKLTYGQIDAAVMLPPLALAVSLGLRGAGVPLIVPMSLSLNGNSVTVSKELFDAVAPSIGDGPMAIGLRLREYLKTRASRPRFAVVHVYSTHNLLLRYWLSACGIDPDRDVEFSVVPPAETADALRAGYIDGFCAGAPWGEVAARADAGRTIVTSSQIWGNHPEKCLAVARDWADENPTRLDAMLGALIDAARFCDRPENADEVARILGDARYLDLDPAIVRESLPVKDAATHPNGQVDRSVFFASAANFPWRSHAGWFLGQMAKGGYIDARAGQVEAAAIYRPDIFISAALRAGISVPLQDRKAEGAHAQGWRLEAKPSDIDMGPDLFCDGKVFA